MAARPCEQVESIISQGRGEINVNTSAFESTDISDILIPDILTPGQYTDRRSGNQRSPEQMLYFSVLEDAIQCWLSDRGGLLYQQKHARAEDAEYWIWQGGGIVTFDDCCKAVDISPEWLQSRLESIRHRRPMKIATSRQPVRVQD